MKIKFTSLSDRIVEDRGFRGAYIISTDGLKLKFSDGEPEDANLDRDFSDVYMIKDLVKKAYDAGRVGDVLIMEEEITDDDEWYV